MIMTMQKKSRGNAFSRAFAVFGAAVAVSAAIENRRRPSNSDLSTLGIEPNAFNRLG
jgi:hypothetical protein